LWVEYGTPGVSNIKVGLVINNNTETPPKKLLFDVGATV
jgi:hypothetical protein